jgi:hypothetical protein
VFFESNSLLFPHPHNKYAVGEVRIFFFLIFDQTVQILITVVLRFRYTNGQVLQSHLPVKQLFEIQQKLPKTERDRSGIFFPFSQVSVLQRVVF